MKESERVDAEIKFAKYQDQKITDKDIEKAEKKAGNLKDKMEDFKLLLRMVKDYWAGNFDIKTKDLAIMAGAIIYVISPLDAIPDIIPVLGWVDDIAIVGIAIKSLSDVIGTYKLKMGLK